MRINDAFPGRFLKSADFETPQILTISGVQKEEVGGAQNPGEMKPVLRFEEEDRGLVLNKTNFEWLADNLGEESDSWTGKKVELYMTQTPFGGTIVPCTRIRAAVQKTEEVPF